ncbi:MAG: TOBE domain-containing protein, partial [Fervidobacterium gondwanense]
YEIYESPADTFVATFIGESNLMKGTVKELISENYALVEFPTLGDIVCFRDKPLNLGDDVLITLRPEKIRISHSKPQLSADSYTNIVHGIVDETIYMGYQTKYFVRTDGGYILKVYKQHASYLLDEKIIQWKDEVYMYWNPDDSFIVEVERVD